MKDTPEHQAGAALCVQQLMAVDTAKDHERDLADRSNGQITEEEYRAAEDGRNRYINGGKVFFNLWLNEYCVEKVAFGDIPCGRCGTVKPEDPCQGCGRSQPVSIEDYYRANTQTVPISEPEAVPIVTEDELVSPIPF
jgi:hypothetical protein